MHVRFILNALSILSIVALIFSCGKSGSEESVKQINMGALFDLDRPDKRCWLALYRRHS